MLLIGCAVIALVAVVPAWALAASCADPHRAPGVLPTGLPAAVLAFMSLGIVIALVAAALILVPRPAATA